MWGRWLVKGFYLQDIFRRIVTHLSLIITAMNAQFSLRKFLDGFFFAQMIAARDDPGSETRGDGLIPFQSRLPRNCA